MWCSSYDHLSPGLDLIFEPECSFIANESEDSKSTIDKQCPVHFPKCGTVLPLAASIEHFLEAA